MNRKITPGNRKITSGLLVSVFLLGASHLYSNPPKRAKKAKPPNIVVLFADDLGYGDLGSFGHPTIRTPNLDRMAQQGVKLTSFYAMPSCTPARAALLTGRYPVRSGLHHVLGPDSRVGIPDSELTLAEGLKTRGYRTLAVGKWHLGHAEEKFLPTSNGFDEYFGLLYSNDMQPPWVQTQKPLKLWRNIEAVEYPVKQETLTERYTEEAVKFIEQKKNRPFFVYLAYSMPHVPISATQGFLDRSRAGLYGAVIETIDWSVGRILETLKKEGLDENTLVVFTSDNGPWMYMPDRMFRENLIQRGDHGSPGPLRGAKSSTYEGGVRVPFLARWPGRLPAGRVSAEPATLMDVYTTLLELTGAEVPKDRVVDGKNILPLLEGRAGSPHKELYYFKGKKIEAVREGKWKLRISRHFRPELKADDPVTPELFDLEADPSERYNRADEMPSLVARLKKKMEVFLAGM